MKKLFVAGFIAILTLSNGGAQAQSSSDFDDVSRMTLLPGWQRSDGYYVAAVQLDLAPGWKTYWRSPGDNGIAPIFDWSGSDNVAQVGYFWPSPNILDENGIRTIGYKEQVILPVLLKLNDPNAPIVLNLDLDYGICDDICLPAQSNASLKADQSHILNRETIEAALALRSTPATSSGLQSATCGLTAHGNDFLLNASFTFDRDIAAHRVVMIETGSDLIWVSEADHRIDGSTMLVEADLQYFGEGSLALNRSALRFTMLNDGQSIEISGCTGG